MRITFLCKFSTSHHVILRERAPKRSFGRRLKALWEKGPLPVADVQQATGEHLAYTTIATMLRKMEGRHLVRHRELGRRFIYEAAVSEQEITRGMADRLVDRLFEGSLTQTVSHLLKTRDIDIDELKQLEQLIQARKEQTL